MKKFYKNKNFVSILLSVVLSFAFVAVAAYGATTIGTNVNTGGTLTVTGNSVFSTASSTGTVKFSTINSDTGAISFGDENLTTTGTLNVSGLTTLGNASTTILSLTGNLLVNGFATTTASNGNIDTEGSLTVVGTASTTNLIVGGNGTNGTIAGIVFGTCTFNPGAITASTTKSTTCTATGLRTTDKVFVNPVSLEPHLVFTSASSTAINTLQVTVYNTGLTGNITPASKDWYWMAIR